MMNPHYPPLGQNNNTPNNPLGFPPTQDFNGHQNANMFGQMPPNGPAPQMMPPNPNDVSQKMQSMSLNGPQGFPPGQVPPGANPQNFGQGPPSGQRHIGSFPAGPPGPQGPPQQARPPQAPPSSAPGPQGFSPMPPQSQTPNSSDPQQSRTFLPPSQGPPSQTMPPTSTQQGPRPPSAQPSQQPMGPSFQGQPGQLPVNQQPMGRPQQPGMPPSLVPNQPMVPKAGQMPPQPNMQPGQMGPQMGMPPSSQPGMPPQGQFNHGVPQQPGLPPTSQFNQPGMPPMPPSSQAQFKHPQTQDQFNQGPPKPGQFGQQPGSLPQQPGGQFNQQGQQMPGLPFMPPPLSQQGPPAPGSQPGYVKPPGPQGQGYPGMPQMPGQPTMPGQPPMPGQQPMPGQPPMPGQQPMPGQPPMPGQQPMPGQPPMPGQQPMPGQPPMQGQQHYPGQPPIPGMQPQYPGQPPMPGQQPMPGQPPSGYPPQYQQQAPFPAQQPSYPGQQYPYQQPQKKLDPDQMPSPIQVMADDQQNRGGIFVTNEKGLVPPLVTTDFIVDDKGNASPRYIRSSMYSVPVTADLLKQTSMPFCLVISPMAETVGSEPEPPLLDFAALTGSPTMGPVRCARCKAYMCPNMKFVDAGRHFKCAFCKATTEVPMEYTQYVNSMQQYGRVPAEMALGTYEIVATKEYCRNNTLPNPPAIVFVIDVSYNSVKSGLLRTVCDNVMDIIEAMPKDETTGKSWTRVGFITYSSTVHFYNIKGTLAQPQMFSVGDVGDMFVPLLEGFLVRAEESGAVLQALLQQLPDMFEHNKETEVILLPAVQAGLEALKAADTCGQLLVFHTSLPSLAAPGRLLNRDDRKLLGTDKEKQILAPQTTEYNELGQSLSAAGVSVELFICNNAYVDVATIGQLARLTGGQVHKYTYFTAEADGPRLAADAARVAARGTAHDAVMRVRTSTGVRPTDFYGHFFMSNTTDIELAATDADKAIGIEIKHDDKLTAEDGVYIQAALLYTHRSGQRRLRVINLALNVAQQLADVYRSVDTDTLVNFLTKQAVWVQREHPPRAVRDALTQRCAKSLAAYRKHCASPSSPGQLVLPESMKLLPLYTSCVLRSDAVAGGPDITCDDRSCAALRALAADVCASCVYTYPRLVPLHALPAPPRALPALRASADRLRDDGVYLLENGVHMLLWVGSQAPADWVRDVLGVPGVQLVDPRVAELPELDNELSASARAVVQDARARRRAAMRLTIALKHTPEERAARRLLLEDQGVDGAPSYIDFLMDVHRAIQKLM